MGDKPPYFIIVVWEDSINKHVIAVMYCLICCYAFKFDTGFISFLYNYTYRFMFNIIDSDYISIFNFHVNYIIQC